MTTSSVAIHITAEQLLEMLAAATRDLFDSMLGVAVQLEREPEDGWNSSFDGVMALIGMAGKVIGNGTLRCSGATACDLSSRFLMSEFATVDEHVLDAIGEITNMIVGGFKVHLEMQLGGLQMSIPSVIYGDHISMSKVKSDIGIRVRCTYAGGEFHLVIDLAAS